MTSKTNEHPEDVKAKVRKTGVSLAELARRNGMAEGTGARALYERMGYAGDALNTAWYVRALSASDVSVDYVTAVGTDELSPVVPIEQR